MKQQSGSNRFDLGQSVQQAEAVPAEVPEFSRQVKDLIKQMLTLDQDKRPSAETLSRH